MSEIYDVIVIGGGQSALAVAYYLRRTGLRYLLLDQSGAAGGSWQYGWDGLRLFSPALWSSLPGVVMPGGRDYYPTRSETLDYLQQYEKRYEFPVQRPVSVEAVTQNNNEFVLSTSAGEYRARAVVSATGSFTHRYVPEVEGMERYRGQLLHAADYRRPEQFEGIRTAIVGEGNSGAQILAEVSAVTDTFWVTQQAPQFLPDHIDGRYLFDAATQEYEAKLQGKDYQRPSFGHIVMVPSVKEARERQVYDKVLPAFDYFYEDGIGWHSGRREAAGAVIFCTGFRPALRHLQPLGITSPDGRINTRNTRAPDMPGLWLVGYGNWTGFASATLIGVGRTARKTVEEITDYLR